jgi:hypothetical protein
VPLPTECRKNIAPPGQAGVVAGGREKDTPSGSEPGSTVASTVVAGGAGQVAQTIVSDHAVAAA